MESFVGNWKARPGDYENFEAFAKELNQPELTKHMNKGADISIVKDGSDYVLTSSQGGVQTLKEIFKADGTIQFVDSHVAADLVKVTHKIVDGKVAVEGTVGGVETKSAMSIVDGKFVLETIYNGVTMKTTHSKA